MNDADVGDLLDRLHTTVQHVPIEVPSEARQRIRDRTKHLRRRRHAVVTGTSAVILIGLAAIVVATVPGDDHRITTTPPIDSIGTTTLSTPSNTPLTTPDTTPATTPAGPPAAVTTTPSVDDHTRPVSATGNWETLPPALLQPRAAHTTVLVGQQLVVWGGSVPNHIDGSEAPFADGAVLDVATDVWRPMAASPLSAGPATGVALGGAALIVDSAGAAATYDPATDAWTPIDGPGAALTQMVLWSGTVVGTTGSEFVQLTGDGWSDLPAADAPLQTAQLVATDRLMMFGAVSNADERGYEWIGDGWQPLPTSPVTSASGEMLGLGVVEDRVVVAGWNMQSAELDLSTRRWQPLPDLPGFATKCRPEVTGVGSTIVVRMCGFVAVRAAGDASAAWSISSPFAGRIDLGLHVDGDQLIAGGSTVVGDPSQGVLTPIEVGPVTIDPAALPVDVRLVDGDRPSRTVSVTLRQSQCVLTVGTTPIVQVTQAAAPATATAGVGASTTTWGGERGSIELACPSTDAFAAAFSTLQTAGERTVPIDTTDVVAEMIGDGTGAPVSSAEALIDAVTTALSDRYAEDGSSPQTAIVWDIDETTPLTATIELLGLHDDSVAGIAFAVEARSTPDGWVVGHVTSASICARGVAAGTNEQFCI